MSDRAFGVEIECYFPPGCGSDDDYYGCGDGHIDTAMDLFSNNGFTNWGDICGDGSLDNDCSGIEVRSPILRGTEGMAELKRAMELLKKNGAWVDHSCGMHVHHNAPDFVRNENAQKRLVKSWYENQSLIHAMVDPDRIDTTYTPMITAGAVEDMEEYGEMEERMELNLSSLYGHGSIEIRLHEGTLNADEALAWVDFGQKFIDNIAKRKSTLATISDQELFLRRIKVRKASERLLKQKAERNKSRSHRTW